MQQSSTIKRLQYLPAPPLRTVQNDGHRTAAGGPFSARPAGARFVAQSADGPRPSLLWRCDAPILAAACLEWPRRPGDAALRAVGGRSHQQLGFRVI